MKFELTKETITESGIKLYRIRALKDFGDVSKGDLGGYVEKEKNLSQEGNSWIYVNANVYGNSWIYGNAKIFDDARIYDDAMIFGYAWIFGNATISDNAKIYGNARIFDNATK